MQIEVGAILEGKVTSITKFGAFVELPENKTGMVHISEVSNSFVQDIAAVLHEGEIVERGRHEELIALDGYYKKLNDMQAL